MIIIQNTLHLRTLNIIQMDATPYQSTPNFLPHNQLSNIISKMGGTSHKIIIMPFVNQFVILKSMGNIGVKDFAEAQFHKVYVSLELDVSVEICSSEFQSQHLHLLVSPKTRRQRLAMGERKASSIDSVYFNTIA